VPHKKTLCNYQVALIALIDREIALIDRERRYSEHKKIHGDLIRHLHSA